MTEERDRDPESLVSTLQQSASKERNEPANNNNDNDNDKDNDNDDENDIISIIIKPLKNIFNP